MKSTATWIATSGYTLLAMTEVGFFSSLLVRFWKFRRPDALNVAMPAIDQNVTFFDGSGNGARQVTEPLIWRKPQSWLTQLW